MKTFRPLAFLLLLAGLCLPASAQTLSDEDLLRLFEQQRDMFRAAQQGGTGQTRGLTLIPLDDAQTTSLAPAAPTATLAPLTPVDPDAPAGPDTTTVTGNVTPLEGQPLTLPDETDVKPVVFGALAPELQVNLNIRFPFDSAVLTPDQQPVLAQMCAVMTKSDIKLFRIVGHTDAAGTDAYNQSLSQLRAEEVQRHLVTECGIAPGRLEALGLGEAFLTNADDPRAPENRRVEFQALS